VSSLNVSHAGEVVQPGQTLAEISPQDTPLVLSAILPNREAGFVKTGMPVQVKLDAYPYQDYGIVPGKVTSISPDAKPDQQLGPVYQVKVSLDRNSVTSEHGSIRFKAGQTASADIIIRRRRIADILLDPIRQFQKGGIKL
jgi:HlyD family secretion protein